MSADTVRPGGALAEVLPHPVLRQRPAASEATGPPGQRVAERQSHQRPGEPVRRHGSPRDVDALQQPTPPERLDRHTAERLLSCIHSA